MVRLSDLLLESRHRLSPSSQGLATVLGDPYLYTENPLFRSIRDASLALGYSFTDRDTDLWRCYQAFSLASLNRLLEVKQIPFVDNTSVLDRMVSVNHDLHIPPRLLLTSLRRNFLMHESAHAVATSLLETWSDPFLEGLPRKKAFVLESLLIEAFANVVERISSKDAVSSLHALFFSLNSYIPYDRAEVERIASLVSHFGLGPIFVIGYCLFFYSNVYTRSFSLEQLKRLVVALFADLGSDVDIYVELAEALTSSGFHVNPVFRRDTNPMYFELHCCAQEYNAFIDAPVLFEDEALNMLRRCSQMLERAVGTNEAIAQERPAAGATSPSVSLATSTH